MTVFVLVFLSIIGKAFMNTFEEISNCSTHENDYFFSEFFVLSVVKKYKRMKTKDSTTTGAIVGLLLPLIVMAGIILYSSSKFESIKATIDHFQKFGLLYQILSISLMPGAGLFLMWSKNKINMARGVLVVTLFYGFFVVLLYLS